MPIFKFSIFFVYIVEIHTSCGCVVFKALATMEDTKVMASVFHTNIFAVLTTSEREGNFYFSFNTNLTIGIIVFKCTIEWDRRNAN